MGKIIYDMSMSLDGFITGAKPRLDAGLGDNGERLHDWGFHSADPRNRGIAEAWSNMGAIIVGRNAYDLSIPHWGADGPTGPARVPTVILSHDVPSNIPDGGVYSFAHSIKDAYEQAIKIAGDKDIGMHGANTAQQFIINGLVDEIFIHLVPVLFGSGIRLFEHIGEYVSLETINVIETKEAIHLRFRVVK